MVPLIATAGLGVLLLLNGQFHIVFIMLKTIVPPLYPVQSPFSVRDSLATISRLNANFDFIFVAFPDWLRLGGNWSCGAVKCI